MADSDDRPEESSLGAAPTSIEASESNLSARNPQDNPLPLPTESGSLDPFDHQTPCSSCNKDIVGSRFQCANCPSSPAAYNLCSDCERNSFVVHQSPHVFLELKRRVDHPIKISRPLLPIIYHIQEGRIRTVGGEAADESGHEAAFCDFCMTQIQGTWYRCVYCHQDLCDLHEEFHDKDHVCLVIKAQVVLHVLSDLWKLDPPSENPPLIHPVFEA